MTAIEAASKRHKRSSLAQDPESALPETSTKKSKERRGKAISDKDAQTEKKVKKSKKSKAASADADADTANGMESHITENNPGGEISESETKLRKRKRKVDTVAADAPQGDEPPKEKKRRKKDKAVDDIPIVLDVPTAVTEENKHEKATRKKDKTKKSKDSEAKNESDDGITKKSREKKLRKKRPHLEGVCDPSGDETLAEQAQKALSYAYTHCSDPPNWKFKKARQNWLIRNLWSSSIPPKYDQLLGHYMASLQGASREKLLEKCKTLATEESRATADGEEIAPEVVTPGTAPATEAATPPIDDTDARTRARALLRVLEGL
ncbi:hypothetical protein BC834DRAFT_617372 [Gloeopeniophorella convolvens]|nr:hypothetical protein BC834DRAFT_617372 [Gloeopeniophorella convolvens]